MNVLVISSPRTASTWFCERLADELHVPNFGECLHLNNSLYPICYADFVDNWSRQGICKIHGSLIQRMLSDECFKYMLYNVERIIFLSRKDVTAQLKSFIIAESLINQHGIDFNQSVDTSIEIPIVFNLVMARGLAEMINNDRICSYAIRQYLLTHNMEFSEIMTEDVITNTPVTRRHVWTNISNLEFDKYIDMLIRTTITHG